jgi:hypothetical protein
MMMKPTVGRAVECMFGYPEGKRYYPGVITAVNKSQPPDTVAKNDNKDGNKDDDGNSLKEELTTWEVATYSVQYDDGDSERRVSFRALSLPSVSGAFEAGQRVEARFPGNYKSLKDRHYGATVAADNSDGTYTLHYDDGDIVQDARFLRHHHQATATTRHGVDKVVDRVVGVADTYSAKEPAAEPAATAAAAEAAGAVVPTTLGAAGGQESKEFVAPLSTVTVAGGRGEEENSVGFDGENDDTLGEAIDASTAEDTATTTASDVMGGNVLAPFKVSDDYNDNESPPPSNDANVLEDDDNEVSSRVEESSILSSSLSAVMDTSGLADASGTGAAAVTPVRTFSTGGGGYGIVLDSSSEEGGTEDESSELDVTLDV